MSRVIRSFAFVLVAVALLASAGPTAAATVEECQAHINTLVVQTQDAEFLGNNAGKDEAGLLDKLDLASAKLAEGKFADAEQKLVDFRDKVALLSAQGKLDVDNAQLIIAGADDAIACVQSLQG
jgi:hypothetical protein